MMNDDDDDALPLVVHVHVDAAAAGDDLAAAREQSIRCTSATAG